MVTDFLQDIIEDMWVNAELFTELCRSVFSEMIEQLKLRQFWHWHPWLVKYSYRLNILVKPLNNLHSLFIWHGDEFNGGNCIIGVGINIHRRRRQHRGMGGTRGDHDRIRP